MNLGGLIDLSDLIGSLIGAFLGFAGAYWLFHLEQSATNKRERLAKEKLIENVGELLEAANDGLRRASRSYKTLAHSYRSEPYTVHPRPINVNTPLATLDRWDRRELLDALQEVKGLDAGMEVFRSIIAFVDGSSRTITFMETAILSVMDDLTRYGHRFDDHVLQLKWLLPALKLDAEKQGRDGERLAFELDRLQRDVHDLGFVLIQPMYERLIAPFSRFFEMNLIDLRQANKLTEILNGARGAYARYGQKCIELAELAERAEGDFVEQVKEGDDVLDKLRQ
jgi:hypothetical protein